jgi:hypothetical protein
MHYADFAEDEVNDLVLALFPPANKANRVKLF